MFFQTYFQIWVRLRINILCTYTVYLPLQACVLKKSYIHVNPNQSPNSDFFSMSPVRSRFYMTVDVFKWSKNFWWSVSNESMKIQAWIHIFFSRGDGVEETIWGKKSYSPCYKFNNKYSCICHVTVPLFFCFALFHYPCFYFEKFKRGRGLQHQNPFRLDSPMK